MPPANLKVMLAWEIDDNQWTLGTSRLFLKAGQLRALEELRDIGGQASQHVIKKIRQQLLADVKEKDVSDVCYHICLLICLLICIYK